MSCRLSHCVQCISVTRSTVDRLAANDLGDDGAVTVTTMATELPRMSELTYVVWAGVFITHSLTHTPGNYPISCLARVVVDELVNVLLTHSDVSKLSWSRDRVFTMNFALITDASVGCRLHFNYVTEAGGDRARTAARATPRLWLPG